MLLWLAATLTRVSVSLIKALCVVSATLSWVSTLRGMANAFARTSRVARFTTIPVDAIAARQDTPSSDVAVDSTPCFLPWITAWPMMDSESLASHVTMDSIFQDLLVVR